MHESCWMSQAGMLRLTHAPVMRLRWRCARKHRSSSRRACWNARAWQWKPVKRRSLLKVSRKKRTSQIIWTRTAILLIAWMCWTSLGRNKSRKGRADMPAFPGDLGVEQYSQEAHQQAGENPICQNGHQQLENGQELGCPCEEREVDICGQQTHRL